LRSGQVHAVVAAGFSPPEVAVVFVFCAVIPSERSAFLRDEGSAFSTWKLPLAVFGDPVRIAVKKPASF